MKILAVDDEKLMLGALTHAIEEAAPDADLYSFRKSTEALDFARTQEIEVAFLDIRMRGMDGLELARELIKLYPSINIIFCTGYDEYISEAFREVRCNGYITKPVDTEQVARELQHLRRPVSVQSQPEKRVQIQCFGYFEAFVDGQPMTFERTKTKELLAYLIHAEGAVCSNRELIVSLWEDDQDHDSYFKKLRKDLSDTLERYGCEDILHKQRAGLSIYPGKVSCDAYDWRKTHKGRYEGEYMKQYTWGELA